MSEFGEDGGEGLVGPVRHLPETVDFILSPLVPDQVLIIQHGVVLINIESF